MDPEPSSGDSRVHLLPCKIDFDGPAPVSSYFKPSGDTAFFRGRELKGKVVEVPAGMTGASVVRTNKTVSVSGTFRSISVWQHDKAPGGVLNECFDAMEISRRLHCTN